MVVLSPSALLLLATQISVLTYHVGVLIYLAPIPIRSLKRWAPLLIQDSIWAVILALSFSALLYLSDLIASWSGYTLQDVVFYAKSRMSAILTAQFILKMFMMMTSIFASAFNKFFSFFLIPLTLNFYALISAFTVVIIIAGIVMSTKAALAALGIVLMSLPFRLGRNAGASLLAFSLVANAMLPYLPIWISFFYQGLIQGYTNVHELNHVSLYKTYDLWGTIYGEAGTYPHGGLIFFNNTNLRTTFIFRIRQDGSYYIIYPEGIPNGTYIIYIEHLGAKIVNQGFINIPRDLRLTYDLDEAPYRLDIHLKDYVFLNPDVVLFSQDCSSVRVNKNTDSLSVITCTPSTNYVHIELYVPGTCSVEFKTKGGDVYTSALFYKRWRGIGVRIYKFGVYGGVGYPITIEITKKGTCYVNWDKIIAGKIIQQTPNNEGLNFSTLMYLIVYMTALPMAVFSFLTIMSLVVVSVARALGASYSRIIFEL